MKKFGPYFLEEFMIMEDQVFYCQQLVQLMLRFGILKESFLTNQLQIF